VFEIALDQNQYNLNTEILESGLYMVKIETEKGSKAEKLYVK
jgi:hypothetical protein